MNKRTILIIICTMIACQFSFAQIGQGLPEDKIQPIKITTEKAKGNSSLLLCFQGGQLIPGSEILMDKWQQHLNIGFSVRTEALWDMKFVKLNLGFETGVYKADRIVQYTYVLGIPANLVVGLDVIHAKRFSLSLDQYIGIDWERWYNKSLYPGYGAGVTMTWFPLDNIGLNVNARGRQIFSGEDSSYKGSQTWYVIQAGLTYRLPN